MRVHLYDDEGDLVWTGELATFVADNELEPDEVREVERDLRRLGVIHGGGGAAPTWRLVAALNNPEPGS